MSRLVIAALVALVPLAANADDAENTEQRLLSAELLEVSTGDFEKARAAFQAIAANEKAAEAVRSKARLGLARCQRKLGQLEAAKRTLDELVKAGPSDPEILRQARSYLKELTTGRTENPDFDWVREIEKNPEVQARVFDWAMLLAGAAEPVDPPARKQLLALGTIALPVIERVLDASRDPVHRQDLALIAVRSGRLERLAVLIDPSVPARLEYRRIAEGIADFCDELRNSSAEERNAVLEILAKTRKGSNMDPAPAALAIAAGDTSDLTVKLVALERSDRLFARTRLVELLDRVPKASDVLAARVLDKSCLLSSRFEYLTALAEKNPTKLTAEHWGLVEELATDALVRNNDRFRVTRCVALLERLGKFDVLQTLAPDNSGALIQEWFEQRYWSTSKLREAPGAWGGVLRKLARQRPNVVSRLRGLADVNDEAAAELASLLRSSSVETPEVQLEPLKRDPAWTPSPKHVELMTGLLDLENDAVLKIALEVLARASQGLGPEVLPALDRVLGSEAIRDDQVRAEAFRVLLRLLEIQPATGPAVAVLTRKIRGLSNDRLDMIWGIFGSAPATVRLNLLRHALALELDQEDAGWLARAFGRCPVGAAEALIVERLASIKTPSMATALLAHGLVTAQHPAGAAFLKRVAQNPTFPFEVRFLAASSVGDPGMEWIDWVQLALADDLNAAIAPNNDWFMRRPRSEQDAFLEALAKSSKPALRIRRLEIYPADRADSTEVLVKALEDPSGEVQGEAARQILGRTDNPPRLLRKLLEHPVAHRSNALYARVKASGDPLLLESLVQLLDDPDPEIRTHALDALKVLRTQLEVRKEWQGILQAAKEQKKV